MLLGNWLINDLIKSCCAKIFQETLRRLLDIIIPFAVHQDVLAEFQFVKLKKVERVDQHVHAWEIKCNQKIPQQQQSEMLIDSAQGFTSNLP